MQTAGLTLNEKFTLKDRWGTFSLARKFVIMGGLIVIAGALIIGSWVARQIEEGVTQNSAIATALYVDSFISPLTRELETNDQLSVGPIRALDDIFKDGPIATRVISVKIWKPDGTVVYSNDYDQIGNKFEPTDELRKALEGEVMAGFDNLDDEEDLKERESGLPLLEIYSPIRAPWTGEVIAVAEFYEDGSKLKETIAHARQQSWLVVAAVMTAMASLLMTIVFQGSRIIDRQKRDLQTRLKEVTTISELNRKLRDRVQRASEHVPELNEQFLERTSAELHDGPAQLLSFASLRIAEASKIKDRTKRDKEIAVIKEALDSAMFDIRNLCKGISLPHVDKMSVREIIERVIRNHVDRTKMKVDVAIKDGDIPASTPVKICVYRFIQEALNNEWKHAGESHPAVSSNFNKQTGLLNVSVIGDGPGFDTSLIETNFEGLGIHGLRERVRSIGGDLEIKSAPGRGTSLRMSVNLFGDLENTDEMT